MRDEMKTAAIWWAMAALVGIAACSPVATDGNYYVRLTVTSRLTPSNVPMDPRIDFGALIAQVGLQGVLDPNSITVVDVKTGRTVPCAVSEDFAYGDSGRVKWVIEDPIHKRYDIRFRTVRKRPPLVPAKFTPLIGVGDLLRYNAGAPRPIALIYPKGLVDLTGDGKPDLVGCWNYAYRPGWPWDGVICYPRVGSEDRFEFGELTRVRYVEQPHSTDFKHLSHTYMDVDFADFNADGLVDMVYSALGGDQMRLFLNSGERDAGGMPVFVAAGSISRQGEGWYPTRAVDLNGDGAIDFVTGASYPGNTYTPTYLRNTNPNGWPIALAPAVPLDAGKDPCFYDVDGDGLLDSVCLVDDPDEPQFACRVAWRRNLGGDPPMFGPARPIEGVNPWWACYVSAVRDGPHRGLLVEHDVYQGVSFYEQIPTRDKPRFRRFGTAVSVSAVVSLSDQAWPFICDWDDDGDWDLLVGGGYGWPRIVINEGTNERPALSEPQFILSEGKPIRLLRNDILGGEHPHNMGYPYPAFADWDGDGLKDLMLPNETNRIFWYKNIGTPKQPRFGKRRQLICDGYPDSPEKRAESARLAGDKDTPNAPYPYEEDQPFFWRTGAGFADLNGDGLMDMITHDGYTRKLTLFVQYRDATGNLHLRKDRQLKLADGRLIDDSIVGRSAHWTESFKCVDWDGDGLTDIVYSCSGTEPAKGSIYLLRNCGTKTDPVFENPVTLCCFGTPIRVTSHGPHPAVGDLNGDGRPDVLTCVEWSVYPFFSHTAIEMKRHPRYRLGVVRTNADTMLE